MSLLTGSTSTGGSINSGQSASTSQSATYGTAATQRAQQNAMQANQSALNAWRMAATYNSDEAAAQREWLEYMANTVYQRTVKDMRKAGINPILAANMGLGTASVGSGATASMTTPSTYMSNTFADSTSSSEASSKSHGSSWNESSAGLTTALTQIAGMFTSALEKMNNGTVVNNIIDKVANEMTGESNYTQKHYGNSMNDYSSKMKQNYDSKYGNTFWKKLSNLQEKKLLK